MTTYYQGQIDKVTMKVPKPYGNVYRIKVIGSAEDGGEDVESNWMSITPQELKKIRAILTRR